MSVISKLNYYGEDKRDWEGKPISNINYKGVDYHFAERNQVANGTCINAVEEPIYDMQISGNSYQPTYTGKNLYDFDWLMAEETITVSGVTFTKGEEGFIVNGISTGLLSTSLTSSRDLTEVLEAGKTYTLSSTGGTEGVYAIFYSVDNGVSNYSSTKTITGSETTIKVYLQVNQAGIVFDNVLVKVQIEEGTTATEIEPYTGGIASPNTDYPQQVESVGDKTSNIFDMTQFAGKTASLGDARIWIAEDGSLNGEGIPTAYFSIIETLKPNWSGVITLSLHGECQNLCYQIMFRDASNTILFSVTLSDAYSNRTTTVNMADYPTLDHMFLDMKRTENNKPMSGKAYLKVEQGEVATDYEPYGYRLPLQIKSKNILDKSILNTNSYFDSGITWNYDENSVSYIASGIQTAQLSTYLLFTSNNLEQLSKTLIDGHRYKLVLNTQSNIEGLRYYLFVAYNNSYYSSDEVGQSSVFTYVKDVNLDMFDLRIYSEDGTLRDIDNVKFQPMLIDITNLDTEIVEEISDKFEEYYSYTNNIYLKEPLRQINGIADYLDYKNNKVVRNIKAFELKGTEAYGLGSTNDISKKRIYITTTGTKKVEYNVLSVLCTHYKAIIPVDTYNCIQGCSGYDNDNVSVVFDEAHQTVESFNAFTLQQYNNGTPVIIYGTLLTPVEESVELPEITTVKGTNIFDVPTEVAPTALSVEYWKQI